MPMMPNNMHDVLFEQAEHRRLTAMSDRVGYVYEVEKDKIRVCMGIRPNGEPWLTPWLHTTNMRGGARERRFFKKGQNVRVSAPGGDFRQATVTHWAEGESFPAPQHADKHKEGETYQLGDLFVTKEGKFYDIFLADPKKPPEHKEDNSTVDKGYSQKQKDQQESSEPEAKLKLRVSEDGGITGRIGKDVRFAAHKDGAKVKAKSNFAVATADKVIAKASNGDLYLHGSGNIYINKPPIIKSAPSDPIKDDDA